MTKNLATLRAQRLPGPKHEENTKEINKGRPVLRWSCVSARLPGPYFAKYGKNPIQPRARRCRQGKAAPAAVRIQHKGRTPRRKITEYRRRNREVQTQMKKIESPRFGSLNETRLAEAEVVERKPKEHNKDRGRNT